MASSAHRKILEAIQARIIDLALDSIPSDNVVILKYNKREYRLEVGIPGVAILHEDDAEEIGEGSTNLFNRVGYPVHLLLCDTDIESGEPSQSLNHDRHLYWRERILSSMADDHLIVSDPPVCRLEFGRGKILLPREFLQGIWVSQIFMRAWTHLQRTTP